MKEYIEAGAAAQMLGVTRAEVITDVQRGNGGEDAFAIAGGPVGAFWLVHSYELEGDRLAMHRKRLSRGSAGSREGV